MGLSTKIGLTKQHRYFTELTTSKALLYSVATIYVLLSCVVVMIQPFMNIPCHYVPNSANEPKTENVMYKYNPCRFNRYKVLLGLTVEECEYGRRLVWAVVLGCLIGWERKQADRPAGIRTMSLVALGSCLFSICSAFAFLSGPMAWDASRISAAIPSGVGFLGSALIFKHKDDKTNVHEVHGLTTAASVWLSAAVGISCAGGMYYIASLSTAIMMVLLRFGPRTNFPLEDDESDEEEEKLVDSRSDPLHQFEVDEAIAARNNNNNNNNKQNYHGTEDNTSFQSEIQRLMPKSSLTGSERSASASRRNISRPSLI